MVGGGSHVQKGIFYTSLVRVTCISGRLWGEFAQLPHPLSQLEFSTRYLPHLKQNTEIDTAQGNYMYILQNCFKLDYKHECT